MKRGYAGKFGERFPRIWRAEIPILGTPIIGIFATLRQATRYLGILPAPYWQTATLWVAAPHFLLKNDFIFHLNSSRATGSGEFKFTELSGTDYKL
jgi:hypothetical protein